MIFAPCQCKCGACGGFITPREQRSAISRCKRCRQQPGPTCRRERRTLPSRKDLSLKFARRVRANVVPPVFTDPETKRIEATLDRLYLKRRPGIKLARLAGLCPAGNSAHADSREPSQ